MSSLAVVQKKLDRLKNERDQARGEQLDIIKRSLIQCTKCRKKSRLSSWTFIQGRYYVEPYSCTGGAYWLNSETYLCHIVCPKCDEEIYLCNYPQRDSIVNFIDSHFFSKSELFQKVEKRS